MGNYTSKKVIKEDTSIDISSKKLLQLPPELIQDSFQYDKLLSLDASDNLLESLKGIKNLQATLRSLNLQRNQLRNFEDELLQLIQLQYLNGIFLIFFIHFLFILLFVFYPFFIHFLSIFYSIFYSIFFLFIF